MSVGNMMQFDNKATNQMMVQIVDDEFDILNVIKLYLQRAGLNVFGFTDPNLALEHFRINCKDYILVVSDIRMPGMNGFEFVRKIRKISPTIKVLLMSAFDVNNTELSIGLGGAKIEGFIQKPISLRELSGMIQKQLDIKTLSS
jgi:two-component system nitrogen regulation response regulator GlnG